MPPDPTSNGRRSRIAGHLLVTMLVFATACTDGSAGRGQRGEAWARVCAPGASADDAATAFPDSAPIDRPGIHPIAVVELFRERSTLVTVVDGSGETIDDWMPGRGGSTQIVACVRRGEVGVQSLGRCPADGAETTRLVDAYYVADIIAATDGRRLGPLALGRTTTATCPAVLRPEGNPPTVVAEPDSLQYLAWFAALVGTVPPAADLRPAEVIVALGGRSGGGVKGLLTGGRCSPPAGLSPFIASLTGGQSFVDLYTTSDGGIRGAARFAPEYNPNLGLGNTLSLTFVNASGGLRFEPVAPDQDSEGTRYRLVLDGLVVGSGDKRVTLDGSLVCD